MVQMKIIDESWNMFLCVYVIYACVCMCLYTYALMHVACSCVCRGQKLIDAEYLRFWDRVSYWIWYLLIPLTVQQLSPKDLSIFAQSWWQCRHAPESPENIWYTESSPIFILFYFILFCVCVCVWIRILYSLGWHWTC